MYTSCVHMLTDRPPLTVAHCLQFCKGKHHHFPKPESNIHRSDRTLHPQFHRTRTRARYYVHCINCAGWGTNPYSKGLYFILQLHQKQNCKRAQKSTIQKHMDSLLKFKGRCKLQAVKNRKCCIQLSSLEHYVVNSQLQQV